MKSMKIMVGVFGYAAASDSSRPVQDKFSYGKSGLPKSRLNLNLDSMNANNPHSSNSATPGAGELGKMNAEFGTRSPRLANLLQQDYRTSPITGTTSGRATTPRGQFGSPRAGGSQNQSVQRNLVGEPVRVSKNGSPKPAPHAQIPEPKIGPSGQLYKPPYTPIEKMLPRDRRLNF